MDGCADELASWEKPHTKHVEIEQVATGGLRVGDLFGGGGCGS